MLFPAELRPEEPGDTRDGERPALAALPRERREREVSLVRAGVRGFREGEVPMPEDRPEEGRGADTEGRGDGLRLGLVLIRGVLLDEGDRDGRTDGDEPGRACLLTRGCFLAGEETLEGGLVARGLWLDWGRSKPFPLCPGPPVLLLGEAIPVRPSPVRAAVLRPGRALESEGEGGMRGREDFTPSRVFGLL